MLLRDVWPWLSQFLSEERRAARAAEAAEAQRKADAEKTLAEVVLERISAVEAQTERTRSELRDEFRQQLQPHLVVMAQLVTELKERMPRVARTRETDRREPVHNGNQE